MLCLQNRKHVLCPCCWKNSKGVPHMHIQAQKKVQENTHKNVNYNFSKHNTTSSLYFCICLTMRHCFQYCYYYCKDFLTGEKQQSYLVFYEQTDRFRKHSPTVSSLQPYSPGKCKRTSRGQQGRNKQGPAGHPTFPTSRALPEGQLRF